LSATNNPGEVSAPVIKRDAPAAVIQGVENIELLAGQCYRPLSILKTPANLAIWSLLTHVIVEHVEKDLLKVGSASLKFAALMVNAGRALPHAIEWIIKHGRPDSNLVARRWTPKLQDDARLAFGVAHNYQAFCVCLPMWHRDRYAVELLSAAHARFTMPGGTRQRQVSAYQKGHRPQIGIYAQFRSESPPQTPHTLALFDAALERASSPRKLNLSYREPLTLWRHLYPTYCQRVNAITRRSASLDMGGYTLGDFNLFFGALTTIVATHDFLCFRYGQLRGSYPTESAVMVKLNSEWTGSIARLSGLPSEKVKGILGDLVLNLEEPTELHLQPFVPLGLKSPWLAVAPPFPLNSRPDENILRILSMSRNAFCGPTSNTKEGELREKVKQLCPQFFPQGPRSLPQPIPDIDLILTDEASSTIVISEAKWIRKTLRAVEHIDRDKDVAKGFRQLEDIRKFLNENPRHLQRLRTIPRSIDQYQNIFYVLLARDHWLWREPQANIAILEFDAFVRVISVAVSLKLAMEELLRYDWLPVEGRDFIVRVEYARAANVIIESEVFYPGSEAVRQRPQN